MYLPCSETGQIQSDRHTKQIASINVKQFHHPAILNILISLMFPCGKLYSYVSSTASLPSFFLMILTTLWCERCTTFSLQYTLEPRFDLMLLIFLSRFKLFTINRLTKLLAGPGINPMLGSMAMIPFPLGIGTLLSDILCWAACEAGIHMINPPCVLATNWWRTQLPQCGLILHLCNMLQVSSLQNNCRIINSQRGKGWLQVKFYANFWRTWASKAFGEGKVMTKWKWCQENQELQICSLLEAVVGIG